MSLVLAPAVAFGRAATVVSETTSMPDSFTLLAMGPRFETGFAYSTGGAGYGAAEGAMELTVELRELPSVRRARVEDVEFVGV